MKLILTLSLTIIANCMIGQNYQCITSDQINYFGTSTLDNIVATRTDSIHVIDGDSIFYSFKTARFDEEGEVTVGAPWFGSKVIIQPDGKNIFFNEILDSIFIETNTPLNDTFLVYKYPTDEWIKGTVSSIEYDTVLGFSDSIKTIHLFSNSPDFDPLTPDIKLGKNNGFVQIFSFYDFPAEPSILTLVGSEYPRLGITKRRKGEIYNFQIGDSINYSFSISSPGYNESYRQELSYTEKNVWFPDSVRYKTHISSERTNSAGTSLAIVDEVRTFYDLNSYVSPLLPGEFLFLGDLYGTIKFTTLRVDYCGRIVEDLHFMYDYQLVGSGPPHVDTTREYYATTGMQYDHDKHTYIEGCGGKLFPQTYFYRSMPTFYEISAGNINWISNNEGDCGTYLNIGVDTTTVIETPTYFNVYPNPTSDFLTITTEKDEPIWYITLTSMNGDLVSSEFVDAISYQLDCNTFKSGNYLLQVYFLNKEPENKLITIVR